MAAKKAPKKAAAAKKPRSTASKTRGAEPKSQATSKPEPKGEGAISSLTINRGHLFALRPRVSSAFRPQDFLAARRELESETYESIEAAARAVAERALALSNDTKTAKRDFRPSQ